MSELFFKIAFCLLWLVYILLRIPYEKRYKQIEKNRPLGLTTEKILLVLLGLGLMLIPLFWAITPLLDGFHIDLPIWLRYSGLVLAGLSLLYFHRIHRALGSNWSPTLEIMKGHNLVKTGPYKKIRHPMYLQIWLWTIAQCLIISNLIAGFSGLAAWLILYLVRVPREERMMMDMFGSEYAEYIRQTGRVFPKIGKD